MSPGGYSFIGNFFSINHLHQFQLCSFSSVGNSAKELNNDREGVVAAIKRIDMDEKVARACARAGARLLERHEVRGREGARERQRGIWTRSKREEGEKETGNK